MKCPGARIFCSKSRSILMTILLGGASLNDLLSA
jgi:hypothetical protein